MKNIPTQAQTDQAAPIGRPTCPEHDWCWGSCVVPNQPSSEPIEHRTYYRVLGPVEQLGESRPDHQTSISTGMAMRVDGEPLVHLGLQTARRALSVRLTFWELQQLIGDLAHAGAVLAHEMARDEVTANGHTDGAELHGNEINGGAWGVPKVECRDCPTAFDPDSSPHADRCQACAERVDGEVTV